MERSRRGLFLSTRSHPSEHVLNISPLLAWQAWKPTCLMSARQRNPHNYLGRCSFGTLFLYLVVRLPVRTYDPLPDSSYWPIRLVPTKLIFPRLAALPVEILCFSWCVPPLFRKKERLRIIQPTGCVVLRVVNTVLVWPTWYRVVVYTCSYTWYYIEAVFCL